MDIDDTMICSRTGTAIISTKYFYDYVHSLGMTIDLITARPPSGRNFTINQLKSLGYTDYRDLHMINWNTETMKAKRKYAVRSAINDAGGNIFLSVGDDTTDFTHGHTGHIIKLPTIEYNNDDDD